MAIQQNVLFRSQIILCSLVSLVVMQGCQQGDQPETALVHGTITLDGTPLQDATVFFRPVAGGRTSTAITNSDGKYELIYIGKKMGAKLGRHDVRIFTVGDESFDKKTGTRKGEIVPPQYNEKTELSVEVEAKDNTVDFALVGRL